MYSNALTTPLATAGVLAVTGPESMTTWVIAAGIAVTRRSTAREDGPAQGRTP